MKKVALLGDGTKPKVVDALRQHSEWIAKKATLVTTDLQADSDLSTLQADLAIVFGGDGFMLSVIRRLQDNPVPVIGINFGKLGFLAEVDNQQIESLLPSLLEETLHYSERMTLDVRMTDNGKEVFRSKAVNDAVVCSKRIRMVQTQLCIDDVCISSFLGDGMIIATPTGTTAHSLAAGGPLLEPTIEAIEITPLASHSLTARPLAVNADRKLEIRLLPPYDEAMLIVDGQEHVEMSHGMRVTVERSATHFRLIEQKQMGYFEILRAKLNWGSSANYGV